MKATSKDSKTVNVEMTWKEYTALRELVWRYKLAIVEANSPYHREEIETLRSTGRFDCLDPSITSKRKDYDAMGIFNEIDSQDSKTLANIDFGIEE